LAKKEVGLICRKILLQTKGIALMKHYQQLNKEERFYIWNALRSGQSQQEVAEALRRHPSTICREIKRNKYPQCKIYTYAWALEILKWRKRRVAESKYRKLNEEIETMILKLIQQYLSPEQVSGYLKRHHQITISHETIYRFIYADKARHQALKPFLRQGAKLRRKRYGSGARASKIPNRVCITERPAIVEEKQRIGDWECDTVIGKDRKSVLVTVVDRSSLTTCCSRVYSRSAKVVSRAIIRMMKPHIDKVHTLTFDNGSEFVQHEKIAKALEATTYFAHPYSSWERGINENTNGLLRQFLPKGTDFREVSWQTVKRAVDYLNNRPRKTRQYLTPNQMFNNVFVPLI
jgi:IS30 family transposase